MPASLRTLRLSPSTRSRISTRADAGRESALDEVGESVDLLSSRHALHEADALRDNGSGISSDWHKRGRGKPCAHEVKGGHVADEVEDILVAEEAAADRSGKKATVSVSHTPQPSGHKVPAAKSFA